MQIISNSLAFGRSELLPNRGLLTQRGLLFGVGATLSLMGQAISAIRRNNGTLIGIPDNALGDGTPNLLSAPEFAAGLADAPVRAGLLTLSSISGYDNAIAFGHDGVAASYAYKQYASFSASVAYTLSVIVKMDDGNAPSFSNVGGSASANNSLALVIRGNATTPSLNIVDNLGGGLFRISATDATSAVGVANIGVVKYTTNDARTFKVTGYKLEVGSTATAYTPQSVLRQRGTYQDSTGTMPVTAVGEVLGLLTDRSYGAGNLGVNLVVNGDFSNGTTGWTSISSSLSVSAGELVVMASSSAQPSGSQALSTVAGKTYAVSVQMRADAANAIAKSARVRLASSASGGTIYSGPHEVTANGVTRALSFVFTASVASTFVLLEVGSTSAYGNAGDKAYFSNITVREVLGNHATQPTTASKPTVTRVPKRTKGPVNQLLWSGDFSNAAWSASKSAGATVGALTTGPDGQQSARLVTFAAASDYLYQPILNYVAVMGQSATFAIVVNTATRALGFGGATTAGTDVFAASELGGGWHLQTVTRTFTATATTTLQAVPAASFGLGAATVAYHRASLFTGTYTAQQILDNGGIPLTTTQPLPNVLEWSNAISFDGSNDFLSVPTSAIGAGETLIVGCTPTGAVGTTRAAIVRRDDAAKTGLMIYADAANTWQAVAGTSVGFVANPMGGAATLNVPVVLSLVANSNAVTPYLNGVAGGLSTGLAPVANLSTQTHLGSLAGSFAFPGHIAAAVRAPVAMSDADRKIIEKWIGSLQGQTL